MRILLSQVAGRLLGFLRQLSVYSKSRKILSPSDIWCVHQKKNKWDKDSGGIGAQAKSYQVRSDEHSLEDRTLGAEHHFVTFDVVASALSREVCEVPALVEPATHEKHDLSFWAMERATYCCSPMANSLR